MPNPSVRVSFDISDDPSPDLNVWDAPSGEESGIEVRAQGDQNWVDTPVFRPWYTSVTAPTAAICGYGYATVYEYNQGGAAGCDIWASTVTNRGEIVQVKVSNQPGFEREPALACNSSGTFLAAWRDRRNDPGGDIYGARIIHQTIEDPDGILSTKFTPEDDRPAITSGTAGGDTIRLAREATPAGSGTGIPVYGVTFAPKQASHRAIHAP